MKHRLDLDNWNRKDHFAFFSQFEEPFFGITAQVDLTITYQQAKLSGASLFLSYLYQSLRAANAIEAFRYRINDGEVFIYDNVHASATINRIDGTFGFSYMNFHPEFVDFSRDAFKEIERVQQSKGLIPAVSGENVIHYSSIPWINFTSLSHARSFSFKDSCPKISFGKITEKDGKKWMPVSVHVHHALMDGYEVGKYLDLYQQYLNE